MDPTLEKQRLYREGLAFTLLCALALVVSYISIRFESFGFTRYDAGWQVKATMSLAQDGTLDLRKQLHFRAEEAEDQVSLGRNGEWYPVHEYLMPLLAVPFYKVFGIPGCLYLNILLVLFSLLMAYRCAYSVSSVIPAIAGTLVTFLASPLLSLSYSFSLDVIGCAFFAGAFAFALEGKPAASGFFFGIMVWARMINLSTLLGFVAYFFVRRKTSAQRGELFRFFVGAVLPALGFFVGNYILYGSPFDVSYRNWAPVIDGKLQIVDQAVGFHQLSFEGLTRVLFHSRSGLFFGMPIFFISLILSTKELNLLVRRPAVWLSLGAVVGLSLFLALYSECAPGSYGNRYLVLSIMPASMLLAYQLERFCQKL